jgi:putative ABC transport system substrate-binding protein
VRAALAVAVLALGWGTPSRADAQPAERLHRIGVLDTAPMASREDDMAAFREGLRALGHAEGRNLVIEYRSAGGRPERLVDLAAELVRLNVDVIVTRGTPAALGARHVTGTLPIVMATSGDPVFAGLVASLARPGGNVTGLHLMAPPTLGGTRLRLLKDVMPRLARVGVLLDAGDVHAQSMRQDIETVARAIGVKLHVTDTRRPADLDRAFEAALVDGVDAVIVLEGVLTDAEHGRIMEFTRTSRLPAIHARREFADAGGLMSYGVDVRELFRRAATYVHRILEGARPADLPVQPPARFELVVNLKTARALGLAIPSSLRRRADHVIE